MRRMEEERVPLLHPSPTAFVRNSNLRTTVRHRPPPLHTHTTLSHHPHHPADSYSRSFARAYVRPAERFRSPGPAILQDRPPLLPPRNTNDILQKTNHVVLRASQSYSYERGSGSPGAVGGQLQLPSSPARGKDSLRKSQSLCSGNLRQSVQLTGDGSTSPSLTTASNSLAGAEGRHLPQDLSPCNTLAKLNRCKSRHPPLQSSGSPILHRNMTRNILDQHSHPQTSGSGNDPRKGISSFFRRSASPSLDHRLRPLIQQTRDHHECLRSSNSNNSGNNSWCHTVIAKLQGRPLSPSLHRATPPASPTTFRRARHPSDTLSGGTCRRYGSLPFQKSRQMNNSNLQSRVEMDPALARERLSRSTLARQQPPASTRNQGSDIRGASPWGERAYMPWPLKSYTEKDSPSKGPQHQAADTPAQTFPVTKDDPRRRRSVSLTASLTNFRLPAGDEQQPDRWTDHHEGSISSRGPRDGERTRLTQSCLDSHLQDPMLTRSRRSRSLNNHVHKNHVPSDVPGRGVHNLGFVSSDVPSSDVYDSRVSNTDKSLVSPSVKSTEVRDDNLSLSPASNSSSSSSSSSGCSSSSSCRQVWSPTPGPRDTVASPHRPENRNSLHSRESGYASDSWPSRRIRGPGGPRESLILRAFRSSESTESASPRSSGYSSDGEQDVWEWFGSEPDPAEDSGPRPRDPCYGHFSFLVENEMEYLGSLEKMSGDYQLMCKRTPPHIRQHFDVFFRQMELIKQFQIVLYEGVKETNGDLTQLADVFQDEQFHLYYRYMVLTPTIQKELQRYSFYFDEHFPDLKRNTLKPTLRINFYAMILDSFKKKASEEDRNRLQCAIDRLNLLKLQANTEMTIATVVNSPVDLRLGGDMMYCGELFCLSGGLLQRKKYNMIVFVNLLVITSPKMSFFKYKVHYRAEQVVAVEPLAEHDLLLQVLTEGQSQLVNMKFKAKNSSLRDQWICELQKIMHQIATIGLSESTESLTSSRRASCKLRPLSLYSLHPQLLTVMERLDRSSRKAALPTPEVSCQELIVQEKKYVRQLSSLLNPDAAVPAKTGKLLEKLYNFHSKHVLPYVERSKHANDVLEYFQKNVSAFDMYSEYLVVRCKTVCDLDTGSQARLYTSPVQQFTFYMSWLQHLCHDPATQEVAQPMLDYFRLSVRSAQVRLLTETIVNGRVDFQRSGDIIRHDTMDVKTRKKELRGGSYSVLLFEKVIILTRPKPPNYEYAWDIWLDQVNLGPPTGSDTTFKLEVRQGGGREPVTYEFRTVRAEVKQEWLRRLQEEMLQQAKVIRRLTSDH